MGSAARRLRRADVRAAKRARITLPDGRTKRVGRLTPSEQEGAFAAAAETVERSKRCVRLIEAIEALGDDEPPSWMTPRVYGSVFHPPATPATLADLRAMEPELERWLDELEGDL